MDLDAAYYMQTIETVFIRHALPKGEMMHRGERVDLTAIRNCGLMTVEGEKDDISGVGQTQAAQELCVNIPAARKLHYLQTGRRPLRRVQRLALPQGNRAAHPQIHCDDRRARRRQRRWLRRRGRGPRLSARVNSPRFGGGDDRSAPPRGMPRALSSERAAAQP